MILILKTILFDKAYCNFLRTVQEPHKIFKDHLLEM